MNTNSLNIRKVNISNVLFFLQLVVGGAIIGLYLSRLSGFVGVELTPVVDTIGASTGAGIIALAKAAKAVHFL